MCTQLQARGPYGPPLPRPDSRDPAQRGGRGGVCIEVRLGRGRVGARGRRAPGVRSWGESPLPPKRGPHHTADALQPGTPRNGSVAELEDRTRIGVRVPLALGPRPPGPSGRSGPYGLFGFDSFRLLSTPVSAEDRTYPVGRGQCCQVPEAPGPGRDSPVLVSGDHSVYAQISHKTPKERPL